MPKVTKQTNLVDMPEAKERPERTNLVSMVGQNIHICDIIIETSERYGDYVVLSCQEGEFYTFSKRVLDVFDYVNDQCKNGAIVRAGINQRNRQVYLTKPY